MKIRRKIDEWMKNAIPEVRISIIAVSGVANLPRTLRKPYLSKSDGEQHSCNLAQLLYRPQSRVFRLATLPNSS